MIKNPVTRPLTESRRRILEANKALQVTTGELLTLAYERGEREFTETLVILKRMNHRRQP